MNHRQKLIEQENNQLKEKVVQLRKEYSKELDKRIAFQEENKKLKSMCKRAAFEIEEDNITKPNNLISRLKGELPPDYYLYFMDDEDRKEYAAIQNFLGGHKTRE